MSFQLPHRFESIERSKNYNFSLIASLRKARHSDLADRIAACTKENPCKFEVCHICGRDYRMQLLQAAHSIRLQKGIWTPATIYVAGLSSVPGRLETLDLQAQVRRARRLIKSSELSSFALLGSLDIGFNVIDDKVAYWQLFLHLLINMPRSANLSRQIAESFPPDPIIGSPVYLQSSATGEDFSEYLSRALKRTFWKRRWSYNREQGLFPNRYNPKLTNALSAKDLLELSLYLSTYPIGIRTVRNKLVIRTRADDSIQLSLKSPLIRPVRSRD